MIDLDLIPEQRGLFLGEESSYSVRVCEKITSMSGMRFEKAANYAELIEQCYRYEPLLILCVFDTKNLHTLIRASRIAKYRKAVSIVIVPEETEETEELVNDAVFTDTVLNTDNPDGDGMIAYTTYRMHLSLGLNLRTIAEHMPVVTELMWNDPSCDDTYLRGFISDKLVRLGIRKELAGHKYLLAAIAIQRAIIAIPQPIKIYRNVAKYYDTTPAAVEKAIRYAIETAWTVGDIEYQHEVFGMTVDENRGKPTNSEFIARLSLFLK